MSGWNTFEHFSSPRNAVTSPAHVLDSPSFTAADVDALGGANGSTGRGGFVSALLGWLDDGVPVKRCRNVLADPLIFSTRGSLDVIFWPLVVVKAELAAAPDLEMLIISCAKQCMHAHARELFLNIYFNGRTLISV
jgi:hypothetical protein